MGAECKRFAPGKQVRKPHWAASRTQQGGDFAWLSIWKQKKPSSPKSPKSLRMRTPRSVRSTRGLSAGQMTELRAKAREESVYLRVVKNTLARRAVDGTDFECLKDGLVGPLLLAFSMEDPGAAARVIKEFAKEQREAGDKDRCRWWHALLCSGSRSARHSADTRSRLSACSCRVMQAPTEKFVRTLNEVPGKLVRTVAAIRDDKQAA